MIQVTRKDDKKVCLIPTSSIHHVEVVAAIPGRPAVLAQPAYTPPDPVEGAPPPMIIPGMPDPTVPRPAIPAQPAVPSILEFAVIIFNDSAHWEVIENIAQIRMQGG